jgi:hypothetical protein
VLKRLDAALRDGDAVHAVIVNSGVNHDGKTSGIFLPNADAQEALTSSVYAKAGLDPLETLYVEAHGTGTVAGMFVTLISYWQCSPGNAGDNAEIQSISRVFGREAGRRSDLLVVGLPVGVSCIVLRVSLSAMYQVSWASSL